jgi:indolepyruvate ferredoxin oxidoreductase
LRGTRWDPFGHTQERQTERALSERYRASIDTLLPALSAQHLALALEIARLPEAIRGYGHVKARHLQTVLPRWESLMSRWNNEVV